MANEIKISINLSVEKNGASISKKVTFNDDMSGDAWANGVVDIATGGITEITPKEASAGIGASGNWGWVMLSNLNTAADDYAIFSWTNSVAADDHVAKLYGGESCIIPFKLGSVNTLFCQAYENACKIEYIIIEL
tara:strand:- start:195 stop:599 length:405 start_codon:yes stop_codon:yes gene_type:complete